LSFAFCVIASVRLQSSVDPRAPVDITQNSRPKTQNLVLVNIVYFDLETQRTANDVGGWEKKSDMGMSLGVTYSTNLTEYRIYPEKRVDDLIQQLLRADLVVGFNVVNFDYQVLMGYTILDLRLQLRTLDLLVEVEKVAQSKPRLDNIAQATLGVGKTADGVDAIKWWREKRFIEVAEYCCFDVKVTKLVHEHGIRHRELFYIDKFNRKQWIEIGWGNGFAF
jgi:DEAD/DEAH box helicase domain-containing protein